MLPDECLQHPWIKNSLERARNKSLKEKTLDTSKLKSYVRNKRFRVSIVKFLEVKNSFKIIKICLIRYISAPRIWRSFYQLRNPNAQHFAIQKERKWYSIREKHVKCNN